MRKEGKITAQNQLSVAMVSPEAAPFASSGGLGDVLGSLPSVLEGLGVRMSIVMPAHRSVIRDSVPYQDTGIRFSVPISSRQEEGQILKANAGKAITVYFIRADRYFDREYLYATPEGDYPDNLERFAFFGRAALEALKSEPPDILHAHDWQSALAVTFLKSQPYLYPQLSQTKTVFTVHNLGFQGLFPPQDWRLLALGDNFFTPRFLEFHGRINLMKGALVLSDAISTVSPSYAEEIKGSEQGFGLEGIFRERANSLTGILNGVDYNLWNPETDRYITAKYSSEYISGKKTCKAALQAAFSLPEDPNVPLVGMVTRLTPQKGLDLLEGALDSLLSRNLQVAILGTGLKHFQDSLLRAAAKYPQKLAVRIVFDETLAHKVVAGSDMLLMPSRYEPCGLTQMYSFKYGTVPVVRASGGLKDTVQEFNPSTALEMNPSTLLGMNSSAATGNGFVFGPYDTVDLLAVVDRALAAFGQEKPWQALMKADMQLDFSWGRSAHAYLELYKRLTGRAG